METIRFTHYNYKKILELRRKIASIGQSEICATCKDLEHKAQGSPLTTILKEYHKYANLFIEKKAKDALLEHKP